MPQSVEIVKAVSESIFGVRSLEVVVRVWHAKKTFRCLYSLVALLAQLMPQKKEERDVSFSQQM